MIEQYMKRVQRLLGDQAFARFNIYDLVDYINEARGFVAAQGECIRILCPSTAGVQSATVTAGGSGYTSAPSIVISPPSLGTQAAAHAVVVSNVVNSIVIDNTGSGYAADKIPSIAISGGGGSGASATAVLSPVAQTVAGQESYTFGSFSNLILGSQSGAASILAVRNVSISWGSMKPTMRYFEWGAFQAYLRSYNIGSQGFPRVWSQFGRGTNGLIQLWPIPTQAAQMDLDCICLPQDLDLQSEAGLEAIPYPFTNAVPYKAAEVAALGEPDLQQMADRFAAHYEKRMLWASAVSFAPMVPDYYDPAARL